MGYSRKALQTYSTDELNTLSEQFSAAMLIARRGGDAFRTAAIAKSNVDFTLMSRNTSR